MFMSTRYKKKRDPDSWKVPLFSTEDSLAKLLDCLSIEYSVSKLITPKWKNFRSQKLQFGQKTRVNNAIWRAWHIQYKMGKRPRFCQFEQPFSDQTVHSTPQAVILDGGWWKKRFDVVSREYKKWRRIHDIKLLRGAPDKTELRRFSREVTPDESDVSDDEESSNSQKTTRESPLKIQDQSKDQGALFGFDSFAAVSDLPDTLFSSVETQKSVMGLSSVEFTDTSDTIQPTLDQLNPIFDELMGNFDFLSADWNSTFTSRLPVVEEEMRSSKRTDELMTIDDDAMSLAPEYQGLGPATPRYPDYAPYHTVDFSAVDVPTPMMRDTILPRQSSTTSFGSHSNHLQPNQFSMPRTQETLSHRESNLNERVLMSVAKKEPMKSTARVIPFSKNQNSAHSFSSFQAQAQPMETDHSHGSVENLAQSPEMSTSPIYMKAFSQIRTTTMAVTSTSGLRDSSTVRRMLSGMEPGSNMINVVDNDNMSTSSEKDTGIFDMEMNETKPNISTSKALVPSASPSKQFEIPELPPHFQAPSLTAHLQAALATRPRFPPPPPPKGKLPRNKSDTQLATLKARSEQNLPLAVRKSSTSKGLVGSSKRKGRLPRNMSDTSLVQMENDVGRGSRRGGIRQTAFFVQDIKPKIIRKNFSDTNLIAMGTVATVGFVARRPQPILPKSMLPVTPETVPKSMGRIAPAPVATPVTTVTTTAGGHFTTFMVNPQPPGDTDPRQVRLYMPRRTKASTSTTQALPMSTSSANIETSKQKVEVIKYQRGFTGTPDAGASSSSGVVKQRPVFQTPVQRSPATHEGTAAFPQNTGNIAMQSSTGPRSAVLPPPTTSGSADQSSSIANALAEVGLIAPLQGLNEQQLLALAQILQNRQGAPDHENAVAYLELLQQQLNILLMQQQQMLQNQSQPSISTNQEITSQQPTSQQPSNQQSTNQQPTNQQRTAQSPANQLSSNQRPTSQSPANQQPSPANVSTKRKSVPEQSTSAKPVTVSVGDVEMDVVPYQLTSMVNRFSRQASMSPESNKPTMEDLVNAAAQTPRLSTTSPNQIAENPSTPQLTTIASVSGVTTSPSPTKSEVSSKPKRGKQQFQDRDKYKEHRRINHVSAEQKRRGNIKTNFETLQSLVPSLQTDKQSRISKAMVLQKGAEYVEYLHRERVSATSRTEALRKEIAELNEAINTCQQQLPVNGAAMTSQQSTERLKLSFIEHVRQRMRQDYTYWIFGVLVRPLFESFNSVVLTTTLEEFFNSVLRWLDQNCSLPVLRPVVLGALRQFSTGTNILTDPGNLAGQAAQAAESPDPTALVQPVLEQRLLVSNASQNQATNLPRTSSNLNTLSLLLQSPHHNPHQ